MRDSVTHELLLDLLDEEYRLLGSGEFDALPALVVRKEQALAVLDTAAQRKMAKIRAASIRNQRRLKACLEGVRAAQRRLRAINAAPQGFTTYDTRGKSKAILSEQRSVEKRA